MKVFWPIVGCISEMVVKFRTFWKKKKSILAYLLPKLLDPKEMFT